MFDYNFYKFLYPEVFKENNIDKYDKAFQILHGFHFLNQFALDPPL